MTRFKGITIANPWWATNKRLRQKYIPRLKKLAEKQRPAIQIPWDYLKDFPPGTDLHTSIEGVEALAHAVLDFADVFVLIGDSDGLQTVTAEHMQDRVRVAYSSLGRTRVNYVCGNEVNGLIASTDKDWKDPQAAVKTHAALATARELDLETSVCLIHLFNDPQDIVMHAKREQYDTDFIGISSYEYQYSARVVARTRWDVTFQGLYDVTKGAGGGPNLGFLEFGPDGDRYARPTPNQVIPLIDRYYEMKPAVSNYVGGGFFWEGFEAMRQNGRVWDAIVSQFNK